MVFHLSARVRRAVPFAAAALLACALASTRLPALAAPAAPDTKSALGASLESSSTAVPLAGAFGYTAHVRLSEPASYLQTRLQVLRPTGKLVYQRTMVENSAPSGPLSYSFGRELQGLDLKPGVYPVRLNVTAEVNGSTEETEVATELLIYDAKSTPVPVVLVARVHGSPLSDPRGRLRDRSVVGRGRGSPRRRRPHLRAHHARSGSADRPWRAARTARRVEAPQRRLHARRWYERVCREPRRAPLRRYAHASARCVEHPTAGTREPWLRRPGPLGLGGSIACGRHRSAVRRRYLRLLRKHGDHTIDGDGARR